MEKKGWAVVEGEEIPWVGNGNQWQLPIFRTKKEAKEFCEESHGFQDPKIIRVVITEHHATY